MIHAFCSIYMYISKSVRDGERPINATFMVPMIGGRETNKNYTKKKYYTKKMYKKEMLLIIQKEIFAGAL